MWFYWNDPQLSQLAIRLLTDPASRIFVSPASHWEIAIKVKIGKLILNEPFIDFVQHAILDNGFDFLPIEPAHTANVAILPLHHKDPFDRMIVAQALAERLPVVSADAIFDAYGIQRFW